MGKQPIARRKARRYEMKSFLCFVVRAFAQLLPGSAKDDFCVCMESKRLLDEVSLMGEVHESIAVSLKVCLIMFLKVFNKYVFFDRLD